MISQNDCSIIINSIGRRAYINSPKGRENLIHDLKDDTSRLNEILAIWGDSPTVTDNDINNLSFEDYCEQKRTEIAAARYAAETGGIEVDGVTIATDRGSQALLTAAVVSARLDPEFTTRWKCDDGRFVTLDALQLRAIGDAVIAHVEACFAREAELVELIDVAETAEDLAAIQWSL